MRGLFVGEGEKGVAVRYVWNFDQGIRGKIRELRSVGRGERSSKSSLIATIVTRDSCKCWVLTWCLCRLA